MGTLTCNVMEFRCGSAVGYAYADILDQDGIGANPFAEAGEVWREKVVNEFMTLIRGLSFGHSGG